MDPQLGQDFQQAISALVRARLKVPPTDVVKDQRLCVPCRSIIPELFRDTRHTQCTLNHHASYTALEESATSGCRLCALFVHAIEEQSKQPGAFKWNRTDAVSVSSTKLGYQAVNLAYLPVGGFCGREMPPDWDDSVAPPELGSFDREIAMVNFWLNSCSRSHPNCQTFVQNYEYLPTRLIEVGKGNSDRVRLIQKQNIGAVDRRYVALSHCWGLNMPSSAKTILANLDDHLELINLSSLTRTFVDAIQIARSLGVPYIWIDSLCIIQDSREDWQAEASQMARVYSCACITLAASGSSDGSEGCHTARKSEHVGPVDLEWVGQEMKMRIYSLPATHLPVDVLLKDPLHQRGWTLQERELSPRVLHYSRDSLRWECQSLQASLEYPWGDSLSFNKVSRLFDNSQLMPKVSSTSGTLADFKSAWFKAVERYTRRSLTNQTDIFPAMSGIAHRIHEVTGDTYRAGHWNSFFVHSLLWTSIFDDINIFNTHEKSELYLAPSWSWASVKCPVSYEWFIHSDKCLNTNPDPQFMPTILEVETVPLGTDLFGVLQSGFIRLSGKVKPAATLAGQLEQNGSAPLYDMQNGVVTKIGTIKYDYPKDVPAEVPSGFLILCCIPRQEKMEDTVGLVLKVMNNLGEFQRVGLATGIKTTWWANAINTVVTIL